MFAGCGEVCSTPGFPRISSLLSLTLQTEPKPAQDRQNPILGVSGVKDSVIRHIPIHLVSY